MPRFHDPASDAGQRPEALKELWPRMHNVSNLLKPSHWVLPLAFVILLPVDFVVIACLWLSDLILLPLRLLPSKPNKVPRPRTDKASIIILNWEGRHLLEEFLPSVLESVRHDGREHEIIVVDNGSRDGSVDFLKSRYPAVRVVALPQNMRFTGGNNAGVQAAKNDIVIFLNNDMQTDPDFIGPLLDGFTDDDVFAISCQVFFQDKTRRREETGKTRARWRMGFIEPLHDQITEGDARLKYLPIFWGGGGSCAFDRNKFLAMGGLDTLYDPFYLEDTDLSYQAWKRGWKSLLAVESVVVHRHRGTNKQQFGDNYVDNTIRKNQYLFIWKNITETSWTLIHGLMLPWIQTRLIAGTRLGFELRAFFRALVQLPEALVKRHRSRRQYRFSDPRIFEETSQSFPSSGAGWINFSERDFAEQLGRGWFDLETNGGLGFRWIGNEGVFCLFSSGKERFLEVKGSVPGFGSPASRFQKLMIFQNGRPLGSRRCSHPEAFLMRVPILPGSQARHIFALKVSHTFCPAREGQGNDTRELGLIISELGLR